jgi:hypothetical protein
MVISFGSQYDVIFHEQLKHFMTNELLNKKVEYCINSEWKAISKVFISINSSLHAKRHCVHLTYVCGSKFHLKSNSTIHFLIQF